MKIETLSPKELLAEYLTEYSSLRSHVPCIAAARFRSGVRLYALIAPAERRVGFFPEFNRVWWRRLYRWVRRFDRLDELVVELRALGKRRDCPFFIAATSSLEKWGKITRGSSANIEDYCEFITPDDDDIARTACSFVSEWVDTFREIAFLPANRMQKDLQAIRVKVVDALTAMPGGRSDGEDERRAVVALEKLQSLLNDVNAVQTIVTDADIFPNLLQVLIPASLSHSNRELWNQVLDQRVGFLTRTLFPQQYPHIQGLASSNEWEHEFVGEIDRARCRGHALVGERMMQLIDIGLELERRWPVLGLDPFRKYGSLSGY